MSKRPRQEGPRERITLNVGGTVFETSRNTLAANSSYFSRLLSTDWANAAADDDYFLDRDPDAFRLLLQFMRHNNLLAILPQEEPHLCIAVLLEAEYLGVEKLLQDAKALARRNCGRSALADAAAEAAAFDAEHGGLAGALSSGVLPKSLFGPPPKPKVLQMMPAQEHDRLDWTSENTGDPAHGNERMHASRRMMGLALVELPDGTRDIDAIFANPRGNVDPVKGPFFLAKADGALLRRHVDGLRCRLRDTQATRETYKYFVAEEGKLQEMLDELSEGGWTVKHLEQDPHMAGGWVNGWATQREEV